jgi:hypothetical protein
MDVVEGGILGFFRWLGTDWTAAKRSASAWSSDTNITVFSIPGLEGRYASPLVHMPITTDWASDV